jgi:hypothetical protein
MAMRKCKPAIPFVERAHDDVICALNMEDLISKSFRKFSK